jgi:hypothetical protein
MHEITVFTSPVSGEAFDPTHVQCSVILWVEILNISWPQISIVIQKFKL